MDAAEQYELLAKAWARRLDKPFSTDPHHSALDIQLITALWNVYPEVIEVIEIDPVSFADRIAVYRHAQKEEPQP
jgi:hypothetical protein